MKKISYYLFVASLLLGFTACSDDSDGGDDNGGGGYGDVSAIINDYVDKTVVPTYQDMKNKAWTLYGAVAAMEEGVTPEKIKAACDAWRATRIPWEQSEAFLFGPANLQGLDPLLDSWPLDQTQINKVLNGSGPIDAGALGYNVRGFHTIEYFIFANGKPKTSITDREFEYLMVVTELLRDDCLKLWSSWAGVDALEERDAEALEAAEYAPANPSYAYQFKNSGKIAGAFIAQSDAIDAIIEGCYTIADEVGAQKIGGPNETAVGGNLAKAVLDVESWMSWNSLDDYKNNIVSIRNSYLGGREGNRGASLSAYVKERNAELDKEILDAIDNAYNKIGSIQAPFRDNLTGPAVDEAMAACSELEKTITKVQTLRD